MSPPRVIAVDVLNWISSLSRSLQKAPDLLPQEQRRSHERYRLIAWAGVSATGARLVSAVVGIATLPLVINHVGKEQFGLWMVVTSLVIWMQLADFGIANGLSNALAEAFGRDDPEAASGYLSTALAAMTAIAVLSLPLLFVAAYAVPWARLLDVQSPTLAGLAPDAVFVVGLALVVNLPLSLAGRAYVAYQRGYAVNVLQAVGAVVSLAGLWLGVRAGLGLIGLVCISAFVPVLFNALLWASLPSLDARLRLRLGHVRREAFSRVAASSVPLFFFMVGALMVNELVNVVIARAAGLSVVADYNIVLRVYLFVFSIGAALSSPFYPAIREAFERHEVRWTLRAVRHSLAVRLLTVLPFALVLLVVGDALLQLWVGKSIAQALGFWGWLCVALSLLLASASSLLSEILSSLDDIWAQIAVVMLSAATVLVLMTLLIPRLGVPGVFLAMAVSALFPIAWGSRRLFRKLSPEERRAGHAHE